MKIASVTLTRDSIGNHGDDGGVEGSMFRRMRGNNGGQTSSGLCCCRRPEMRGGGGWLVGKAGRRRYISPSPLSFSLLAFLAYFIWRVFAVFYERLSGAFYSRLASQCAITVGFYRRPVAYLSTTVCISNVWVYFTYAPLYNEQRAQTVFLLFKTSDTSGESARASFFDDF